MTLNEFKEKLASSLSSTGAKKVAATLAITMALSVVAAPAVYASVPAGNIVGDAQVTEDRTEIKIDDAQDIHKGFYGFDRYGNQTITMADIKKAIELSDILNGYYFDAVNYTNTTKEEVLELDVDKMYEKYIIARYGKKDRTAEFCAKNLENKPAIDAYITFSCGTVSNNIKQVVGQKVNEVISSEGFRMTQSPRVIITNTSLYVAVEVQGQTQLIELNGEAVDEIIYMCNSLDNHYNIALNNIAGYSDYYENTLAYNGVDQTTSHSAWLSLPDSEKQEEILAAITTYENLDSDTYYEIICEDTDEATRLSKYEQELLRDLGYDRVQVRNAVKRDAVLQEVLQIRLSK